MEGRLYQAQIDIVCAGGQLPGEERDALGNALRRDLADFCLTVREELHPVVVVAAELRAANPLDAITSLSASLDQALFVTGLLEKFDITGRVLHVRPIHARRGR